ncbi:ribosomal subunit interface protein [Nitrosomonas oligotropha]|uniref:Ribosomal subunit interface protein n=1 Tax=Nitrosomonas oligotropha TaxID=42354 RepID=A0A2T5HXM7_9PROT|nr:ribosome-associated translation inhibitor RaiA [Nitrosomonas oligotropha]PTQ76330.1 ribosomal subunit interface protein [Nitrosomonas oligotropha]
MEVTLQITTRDIPHSEALESHIREKAEKLEKLYPHITSCRIVIELPHKHHHQGRMFDVHIDMTVPGSEIVVNRVANEDVYVAVRDAFDAAKRQLEDHAHK